MSSIATFIEMKNQLYVHPYLSKEFERRKAKSSKKFKVKKEEFSTSSSCDEEAISESSIQLGSRRSTPAKNRDSPSIRMTFAPDDFQIFLHK